MKRALLVVLLAACGGSEGGYAPPGDAAPAVDAAPDAEELDPCIPDPCTAPHTICAVIAGEPECVCDAGFHSTPEGCVPDEVCTEELCGAHGECDVTAGVAVCTCNAGYEGPSCDTCAAGWHDDGAGGCTTDICLPNPCVAPHQTVCAPAANDDGYACGCDSGYHDDGAGHCTDDPCLPNPCAATGQACADTGNGTYACHDPVCASLPDGASCATTACVVGAICQGGQCVAGTPVVCDDDNACTADACDAVVGCQFIADDTLIPSDGLACTIDRCESGAVIHETNDAACDDGQWCTGVEHCSATLGCVTSNVPAPPRSYSPCIQVGACNEATHSFPVTLLPAGASCSDGIGCTSGDECQPAGACAGHWIQGCGDGGMCSAVTAWQADIDFSMAVVTGELTFAGGPPPSTELGGYDVYLYAVNRSTDVRQLVARLDYEWQAGGSVLVNAPTYEARLLPGVYDILYVRGSSASESTWYPTLSGDTLPAGRAVIASGVVLGPGPQRLDLDLGMGVVSGNITFAGDPMPPSELGGYDVYLYAVNRSTGVRQLLASVDYQWQAGGSALLGPTSYESRLVPGRYDLLYVRGSSGSEVVWYPTIAGDTLPAGYTLIREDVLVGSGPQTLDVDLDMAIVSGRFRFEGGAPPASELGGYDVHVYAVSRTTRRQQLLARLDYEWQTNSSALVGSVTYESRLVPGRYDLLYVRGSSGSEVLWYPTLDGDTLPAGYTMLREDVTLVSGPQTLDLELGIAIVRGDITVNGAAPPPSELGGYDVHLFAVSRTTGRRQRLATLDYQWQNGGSILVGTASYEARLLPGDYDILYVRGSSASETVWYPSLDGDTLAAGYGVVAENIHLTSGPQTLDLDLGMGIVSGSISFEGGAPPASELGGYDVHLFAINRSTGVRQSLARLDYQWQTSASVLVNGPSYEARLLPGVYDVLYVRGSSASETVWYPSLDGDTLPAGYAVVAEAVVIGTGAQTLDIDLGMAVPAGEVTVNGGAPPPSELGGYDAYFYAVNRSTGVRQLVARLDYEWQTTASSLVAAPTYVSRLVPGLYDLLYVRGSSASVTTWYPTLAGDTLPAGYGLLRECVTVP